MISEFDFNLACDYNYISLFCSFQVSNDDSSHRNAVFRTQEPEYFDDIVTVMTGSYLDIRDDEAKVPCLGSSDITDPISVASPKYVNGYDIVQDCQASPTFPSDQSSGCGTLGTDFSDDISYHTMSPTGLSPIVKTFSDMFIYPSDEQGCMVNDERSASEVLPAVVEEIFTCASSEDGNPMNYIAVAQSESLADHDEDFSQTNYDDAMRDDSENVIIASTQALNQSQVSVNGLTGNDDRPSSYVSLGTSVNTKPFASRQADPYVKRESTPAVERATRTKYRNSIQGMSSESLPTVLESCIRSKDTERHKTEQLTNQQELSNSYVQHSSVPGTPIPVIKNISGTKDKDMADAMEELQSAQLENCSRGDGKMSGEIKDEISLYVRHGAITRTVHCKEQDAESCQKVLHFFDEENGEALSPKLGNTKIGQDARCRAANL